MEPKEPQTARSYELLHRGERELLAAGLLALFAVVSVMLHFRLELVGYPATPVPPEEYARGIPALLFGAGLIGKLIFALPVIAIAAILVSAAGRKRAGAVLYLVLLLLALVAAVITFPRFSMRGIGWETEWAIEGDPWKTLLNVLLNVEAFGYVLLARRQTFSSESSVP